jgi:hypothetical protein
VIDGPPPFDLGMIGPDMGPASDLAPPDMRQPPDMRPPPFDFGTVVKDGGVAR